MNDGLNPIKHVYGQEPSGPAPEPGTPEYAEFEALRAMKEALDASPRSLPHEHVVDAVKDAAMAEVLLPLRHVYGEVYGEEVAKGALDTDDARFAEYELLRTTKTALDTLPRARPDVSVLDVVKTAAAAHVFAPLQVAYGEGEAPAPDSPQSAEYALLSTTKAALEQLPAARPDAAVVAAVLAAARPGAPALKVASDRPAHSKSNVRRWMPALAMAASVVIVAVTGLWVARVSPVGQQAPETELLADAETPAGDDAVALAAPAEPEAELLEAPPPGLFSPLFAGGQPTVSQDRLQGHVAARTPAPVTRGRSERRAIAQAPPPPPPPPPSPLGRAADAPTESEMVLADAVGGLNEADTNAPVATVSEWDAGADVRVLSLRLSQLANSSEGLSWDAPPTPLGAADLPADAPAEGIRAVRFGASSARVDVQMRSSEQQDDQ